MKYEIDSRKVKEGQTFVAIKGHNVDGHNYIDKAIQNGAIAVIGEDDLNLSVPYTRVINSEEYLNELIVKEYSDQVKDLNIIGVTGTNGKTTSCYLMYQMLNKLNINAAYIGTLGYYHNEEFIELENTTPDILNLYKLLLNSKEKGCTHVVMEVSSHSLDFKRVAGINFVAGGFTNLTQDHLDYHKTMENYLKAKMQILDKLKDGAPMLLNSDDEASLEFMKKYSNSITFGEQGDYKILSYNIEPNKTDLTFSYKDVTYNVCLPLTSKFNIYNYLTSLSILSELGIDIKKIIEITPLLKAPKGRCETVEIKEGFAVIDYAHTPDAVLKVISAYNEIKKGKVITIIGCGGDRDPKKRPIMGKIAVDNSDYVIFTNDNPRTEDEKIIMNDIVKDLDATNFEVIHNRVDAIGKGVELLNKDDILLVLGKGHEDYQIIGTTKHHLDDLEEVLKLK